LTMGSRYATQKTSDREKYGLRRKGLLRLGSNIRKKPSARIARARLVKIEQSIPRRRERKAFGGSKYFSSVYDRIPSKNVGRRKNVKRDEEGVAFEEDIETGEPISRKRKSGEVSGEPLIKATRTSARIAQYKKPLPKAPKKTPKFTIEEELDEEGYPMTY